ncbi:sugar transferase [Amycolatopsis benzoatilytica]|uniref:sugar transferase n=1 Tax=Amycolatopsis benzoatilytica TaxID=346045 RepID=UPI0003A4C70E|nr:sugar transferase [Amycolatopsis benzoatilytica]
MVAVLAAGGQYRPGWRPPNLPAYSLCLIATVCGVALATALWLPLDLVSAMAAWTAGVVLVFRCAAAGAVREWHRRGHGLRPALVIGAGQVAHEFANTVRRHPECGLRLCGVADRVPAGLGGGRAEVVIACGADDWPRELAGPDRPVQVWVALTSRCPPGLVPGGQGGEIGGVPIVPLRAGSYSGGRRRVKRAVDVLAGTALLAVLAPVLAALAALVRVRCGPPALFTQIRDAGEGRQLRILKLRTLPGHPDADTRWAVPQGCCGRLGRWLRRTHLDELPQLVNVVRGEMSLVGPRPERPYFTRQFAGRIPGYLDRQRMPAGITGWAQVHGLHGDTSIAERIRFDNAYIDYWSPWLDVRIMLRTLVPTPRRPHGGAR